MQKLYFLKLTVFFLALFFTAFKLANKSGKEPVKKSGISIESMDKSIDPRIDFYHFANGNWAKNNPIPETESSWGSFSELKKRSENLLHEILDQAAADKSALKGSINQQIGDFYYTAMDTLKIELDGIKPLAEETKKINAIKSNNEIPSLLAHLHSIGVSSLFSFYVSQDAKNSSVHITYAGQGGLGLPDRDYYLKEDEKSINIRKEYLKYLTKVFEMLKDKAPAEKAKTVIKIETELANASLTRTEQRDIEKRYNKLKLSDLQKITPSFNWKVYTEATGITKVDEIIVSHPPYFNTVENLMKTLKPEDWKTYNTWHLYRLVSPKINSDFEKEHFYFYNTILAGVKEMKPRWERALAASNDVMGELLGQAYVKKAFSPQSKEKVNEMVDNLLAAFKERILQLDWMDDQTKNKALVKLASFNRKLGYPDKWKDFSELKVDRDSYVGNFLRARKFHHKIMIDKIGKPIDKTEWGMSPQTINAYYSPLRNEIVFPAAIMQAPFFNPDAEDAINYGSMGAVIGHEITHGFDDQGCKFNSEGNLENWWLEVDMEQFKAKTNVLVTQFNNYKVSEELAINGQLTLGENIADIGGLSVSYYAYQKSLLGKERVVIDGFSPEQRFFIGWAQVWKINMRPEHLRNMILTNPHSPGMYRVLGPLSNMPEFHAAFGVKPGDAMYREENNRAKIW
ncbi:MAG: M13 family metallopeptidase [Bacteroidetes bacterium]|nr:M13 family metallopeptidase [Bacteroidota bacterium]HET6245122.1 M13 family metallopeptidase [Bacteroidia bacterium]